MRLYFVRHGQTDWNKERRLQGQVDIPLNAFGELLAEKTRAGLAGVEFAVCYTSPLKRAKRTAELILEGKNTRIIEEERIKEMSFGIYEGRGISKDNDEVPEEFHDGFVHPERFKAPEGGEDFGQLMERTGAFLNEICEKEEYRESDILVSTHGAALAALLANIRGVGLKDYWGSGVHKNCAVTAVDVTEHGDKIVFENKVYYDDKVEDWNM